MRKMASLLLEAGHPWEWLNCLNNDFFVTYIVIISAHLKDNFVQCLLAISDSKLK